MKGPILAVELADLLVFAGFMPAEAQDDPEGYDNHRTMMKVDYLAELLNARVAEKSRERVNLMPVAAKAFCVVTAGIIPGELMPEHSRQWTYTSVDYEADRQRPEGTPSLFETRCDEAMKYARELIDPSRINWVKVDFVWV